MEIISSQPGEVEEIRLYAKDAKGAMRIYSISCQGYEILTSTGLLLGAKTINSEFIDYGKASRSRHEQALSRIKSIVNKQIDKGYVPDHDQALEAKTNSLGFKKPMKAIVYTEDKIRRLLRDDKQLFIQQKFDGHRCVMIREGLEVIAYSSGGKQIKTIHHILHDLQIPEGIPFDGELYIHGMRLQDIGSRVKRAQDGTPSLKFICFDVMVDEDFLERNRIIQSVQFYKENESRIVRAPCHVVNSIEDIDLHFETALHNNYEGSMIRVNDIPYEDGKRSSSILKKKKFFDSEFKILKVHLSERGVPVAVCQNDKTDKQFNVTLPGSDHQKHMMYLRGVDLVGKHLTVKYPNRNASGIPAQPVALRLREDI